MIDPGLKGKVVCITGANNPYGIGAAVARAFAAQGAAVFLHYFRQGAGSGDAVSHAPGEELYRHAQTLGADHLLDELRAQGCGAEALEADLLDASAPLRLMSRVEDVFGAPDVLVNNAALCEPDSFAASGPAADTFEVNPLTADSHDRHFAVNSRAPALLMKEFARLHVKAGKRQGRIINISTDAASGAPNEVSYWASKHALESYSRAAACEYGRLGITVNIASLGPIQTGWISAQLEAAVAENTPLGRVGAPEDVADVVVFLASDQARWITGQLLYIGGGHRMPL